MKTGRHLISEQDLGSRIVYWLQDQDFEVFQEVQIHAYGRRADLVGRRGSLLVVVETKLQFGERVIEQAQWWSHEAHLAYVATLHHGRHALMEGLCQYLGIGVLKVEPFAAPTVSERVRPRLNRTPAETLAASLREEQKTFAPAGNAESRFWTPFQATSREMASFVRRNPGCKLKEAIDNIRHHYSSPASAIGALRKWIEAGKVQGIRHEWDGRKIRLYPTSKEDAA